MMERRVTTQDISWFLDLHHNKQLNLQPSYQRRSVWSPRDRRYFLDTIFRGYPSPAVFLHKVVDANGRSIHEVVDGKQRLETILLFINNKIAVDPEFGDVRLNGKRWKQITDPELRRVFWDYVLPVEFIRSVEGTIVNEVFDRLNRNSRRLERQELRHAKYDGWFVNFAENETETAFWKDVGVVTTSRSKRMKDIQFISELLMIMLRRAVAGFDQDELDELYAEFDIPTDTNPDFEPDKFREEVDGVKRFLGRMIKHCPKIEEHLGTLTNVYSLWGVLALNRDALPMPDVAADRYHGFMEEVERLSEKDLEQVVKEKTPLLPQILKYLQNATGASTEPAQRQARHEVLTRVLLGE